MLYYNANRILVALLVAIGTWSIGLQAQIYGPGEIGAVDISSGSAAEIADGTTIVNPSGGGVNITGEGSSLTLQDGSVIINTTGTAINTGVSTTVNLARATIGTTGNSAHIISGSGYVNLGNNSNLTVYGTEWSMLGYSFSGTLQANNLTYTSIGTYGHGFSASEGIGTNNSVRLTGSNWTFNTSGIRAYGLMAALGNTINNEVANLHLITSGNGSSAVRSTNNGLINLGTGVTIDTTGGTYNSGSLGADYYAYGIYADDGGRVTGRDVTISTLKNNAEGVFSWRSKDALTSGTRIDLTGTLDITTKGNSAYGLSAKYFYINLMGIGGEGGIITSETTRINTAGSSSHGIYTATKGSITTGATTVKTTGGTSHGIYAESNSNISTGSTSVVTEGSGSHAIFATGSGTTITLNDGTHNLSVSAANAYAINATSYGKVFGTGQFIITGNINTAANSTIDLTMTGETLFTGGAITAGTGTTRLRLRDEGIWALTRNSQVTSLEVTGGILDFASASVANLNLKVTGDFSLSSGSALQWGSGALVDVTGALRIVFGASELEERIIVSFGDIAQNQGMVMLINFGSSDLFSYAYDPNDYFVGTESNGAVGIFGLMGKSLVYYAGNVSVPETTSCALLLAGISFLTVLRRSRLFLPSTRNSNE